MLKKNTFKPWTIPIALFGFVILGFGLLIGGMGFYQDDWYLVWMGRYYGPQIYLEFFAGSRPFLAGIYMLTTQLIGDQPLSWQVFGLLTRWLAVLAAWWALKALWPDRLKEITWIAILLALYPGFKQHFVSVVYSNTYIALAAFFFSLGAMLLAIRQPNRRWLWTLLGLLAAIFNLVTTEYFFGMELFRPVFLWTMLTEQGLAWQKRLRAAFLYWAPYLLVMGAFLVWRLFFFTSYMYENKLLDNLTTNPQAIGASLFLTLVQDAFETSLFAWLQTWEFARTAFPDLRSFAISWGIFSLAALLVGFYLARLAADPAQKSKKPSAMNDRFARQAVFLGIFSTLIAGWPFWAAGLQVELSGGFDRFSMAYMFGAAILVVGLLESLVKNQAGKIAVISLLAGAAVLFQIRNAQTYQQAHTVQAGLFQQLVWRAPGLKTGARLLINDVPVDYTGNASMNAALNWVYGPEKNNGTAPYLLLYLPFKLGSPDLPDLEPSEYNANSLVAFYTPPGCVQLLDPKVHQDLPRLNAEIQQALPLSDLSQVDPQGRLAAENYRRLFGRSNRPDWCYYFESADLARQLGDWKTIVTLGDEALQAGLGPNDKFSSELLPFIEGYGRLENWKQATSLTESAYQDIPALGTTLCQVWDRIQADTPASDDQAAALEKIQARLNCAQSK
ncbi:MAG: hypothetical protein MUE67_03595 [Anaerolineales bacterium]|nr:hypothetical protein [Anaerolineales bacterium]